MQTRADIVTVAIREAGVWRCSDDEPQPSALLMCDVRRGRPAETRAELSRRLIAACEELRSASTRRRSRSSSPSTPATRCTTRSSVASIGTGTALNDGVHRHRTDSLSTAGLVDSSARAQGGVRRRRGRAGIRAGRACRVGASRRPASVGTIRGGVRDFARERGGRRRAPDRPRARGHRGGHERGRARVHRAASPVRSGRGSRRRPTSSWSSSPTTAAGCSRGRTRRGSGSGCRRSPR